MVIDAMHDCGVDASNTVLVGDTIYDAQCATNAGVPFVGVGWGYNSAEMLMQNGARTVVNNFAQLHIVLNEIISKIA